MSWRVFTLLAAVMLAACSASEGPSGPSAPSSASSAPAVAEPSPSPAATGPGGTPDECAPGAGRDVEPLTDVVVPEVVVPPVVDAGGEVVLAGFTLPEQVVDAGCVIRYDAAGGCLGAVRITGVTIPEARIPAATLEEEVLDDGTLVPSRAFPEVVAPAVSVPAVSSPEVCQVRREGGLPAVTRAGVVREGFSRDGVARPGGTRPERCAGEDCAPAVEVPTVRIEPVRVPDVDVDPARLESRRLAGRPDVRVLTGERRVSFVTTGSVLFAFDRAEIRPGAEGSLRAVAQEIRSLDARSRLLVEGHTDDRGEDAYNLALSRSRARAVTRWLAGDGFDRQRISARGLGSTRPAVPNSSAANRARNRRVVITVLLPR